MPPLMPLLQHSHWLQHSFRASQPAEEPRSQAACRPGSEFKCTAAAPTNKSEARVSTSAASSARSLLLSPPPLAAGGWQLPARGELGWPSLVALARLALAPPAAAANQLLAGQPTNCSNPFRTRKGRVDSTRRSPSLSLNRVGYKLVEKSSLSGEDSLRQRVAVVADSAHSAHSAAHSAGACSSCVRSLVN